jgi:ribonucleoside-diphosphate reductase alpha chain
VSVKIIDYIAPILKSRYLLLGENPEGMLRRVATFIASQEIERDTWAARFFAMMDSGDFMPSSPILMNAGTDYPMMSACFVLDIPDEMGGIFQAIKDMALIQQHGGGTGFNFSKLREKGAIVRSTHGVASGVLSFLEVFNSATNIVKQGGKRRGANIALLSVDHPEIEDFIDSKLVDGKLSNFNISVAISDKFMEAAFSGTDWPLISRVNGAVVKVVKAQALMAKIVQNMWKNGEPGIIFSDTIEASNPTPWLGPLTGVNPCGEVSLYDKEACNLGSINLEHFANVFTSRDELNRLQSTVRTAVRFLDDTIDLNVYPVVGIREAVQRTRKIGLGVTGLHSWLLLNGYKYSSQEGRDAASGLLSLITNTGRHCSEELAEEKGSTGLYVPMGHLPVRNSVITCIAPTGTISMILDTSSSGIEPVFSYTYERRIGDETYHIETGILRDLLAKYKVEATDELIRQIENEGGVLAKIPSLPQELRELAETAQEIDPFAHLAMLSSLQAVVDNNISKTIAIPNVSNVDLFGLIMEAWNGMVRGFTVYRDGSREGQVINAVERCPVCGQPVIKEEGCKRCGSCGWSTCTI